MSRAHNLGPDLEHEEVHAIGEFSSLMDESVLRRAVAEAYGIAITVLTPEHEGADSAAWAYRATATDGSRWFVKLGC